MSVACLSNPMNVFSELKLALLELGRAQFSGYGGQKSETQVCMESFLDASGCAGS